jgi:phosphoribosylformylglycinamidine cyclo-ligase
MTVENYSESYKAAGVDVTAGYKSVELIKAHVARTKIDGVLSGLGGFGGLFAPDLGGMKEPVFVSGTDGVGTKLRIAMLMNKHDTIGIDSVAMCVNDVICAGARPLFFLDYLAVGRNVPERVAAIVSGVAEGCVQAGCALVGGETAEHPGMMRPDDYDIAGFAVGVVDKKEILDSANVRHGDAVIGLASSGVHSNGFSLIRQVFDVERRGIGGYVSELGRTLGEELLTPTTIYVSAVKELLKTVQIRSISHITGGGFYENIPRALPKGLGAVIEKSKLESPPIFRLIQQVGAIPERDMFGTFNMGLGMCVIVPPEDAATAIKCLARMGQKAAIIGEVRKDADGVVIR